MACNKQFVSSRRIICILGATAVGLMYSLRVNLSVAIVAMVNQTTNTSSSIENSSQTYEVCYQDDYKNESINQDEYDDYPVSLIKQ